MRSIQKGREPDELVRYRQQPDAEYDGPQFTPIKEAIREYLLSEQSHLCAYCMQRIHRESMKVEHWRCQDYHPNLQLDYKNLLGVCPGNAGQPQNQQTCDTRKGNQTLKYNPANPEHHIEDRVRYRGNGEIFSEELDFNKQIEEVLNLNHPRFKANRKAVFDAVCKVLGNRPGTRTATQIRKFLQDWTKSGANDQLPEYCGVAVYFLNKHLRQRSA